MQKQKSLKWSKKNTKKKFFLGLGLLGLSFFYPVCYAFDTENQKIITVVADTLQFNNDSKIGIYRGHIKLTQGTRILTADYATSYANKEGQIFKIIAIGRPACYRALVFRKISKLIATGNTIYYYPYKDWLEAVGDARIIQGENYFQGPQINYDFQKKTVASPLSKDGHTQILLAPFQSMHS